MCKCKYCGKILKKPCALGIHERTCKLNPNRKPLENHVCGYAVHQKKELEEGLNKNKYFKCKYCGKVCKNDNSYRNHERTCPKNENRVYKNGMFGKSAWNKGLTKEIDIRVKKQSNTLKEKYKSGELKPSFLNKNHTKETKIKLSEKGGYRIGSGRGKHGWYKGFYCDSSWELAFVIYNLEHNISFNRNKETFEYVFNGEKCKYLPDFIIDDTIIEIKGYETIQWKSKLEQFPKNKKLLIIGKKEIKPYLNYVIEKYGKNFIKLYDKAK